MTKKDYELIAETVACFNKQYPYWNAQIKNLISDIADSLKQDNDRFDKIRFMEMCKFPN